MKRRKPIRYCDHCGRSDVLNPLVTKRLPHPTQPERMINYRVHDRCAEVMK